MVGGRRLAVLGRSPLSLEVVLRTSEAMRMIKAYPYLANVLLPTVSVRIRAERGHVADDPGDGPRHRAPRWAAPRRSSTATAAIDFATLRDDGRRRGARRSLASGIEPGDRVAVWAPNSLEWIVAALGVTTAGGVLVPINTRFKGAEAAYVLARSGAARAVHRPRVPRHRLSRAARERRRAAARARAHGPARGRAGDGARSRGTTFVARGDAVSDAELDARVDVDRSRRSERRRVHVGHDREPEGRRDDARPDAARVPRLVRLGRPARRATAT